MGGRRSLTTETRRLSDHCGRDWRDVATGQGVLTVTDQILEEAGLGFSLNASRGSQPCLYHGLGPWKPVSEYRAPELGEAKSLCCKSPACGDCYSSPRETVQGLLAWGVRRWGALHPPPCPGPEREGCVPACGLWGQRAHMSA